MSIRIISIDILVFNVPYALDMFEFRLWQALWLQFWTQSKLDPGSWTDNKVAPMSSVATCWVLNIVPNYLQNRCIEAELLVR